MNIYKTRQLLRQGISIFEIELRVGYYARVSTDKEEQKNSIINQEAYFKDLIERHPKWKFVRGYVDDGISGLHTQKRENFHNMLEDSKSGEVDLILTKEITRFARNTLDSIMYTREMLSNGTCIWFINDNINTIDEDSELRLTIMSGIAQDEVRKMSSRIKFGHAQSIKKGVVLGNSLFYGYDKKDGKLLINEKEAEMIKLIFHLYASGDWSTKRLEDKLFEMGYKNHKGGKISNVTIQHILQNPKYKGYYCGGKVRIVDMFTKKQEFLPEEEWTMYKDDGDTVPAIVSEELWDAANKLYAKRSEIVRNRRTSIKSDKNLLTGKVFCEIDGSPYWLKSRFHRGKPDLKWRCSHKISKGAESCPSFSIDEYEIRHMIADILNTKLRNFDDVIEEYLTEYKKMSNISTEDAKQKEHILNEQLEAAEKKKDKLLDCMLSDLISKSDYKKKVEEISNEISEIKNKLYGIEKDDAKEQSIIAKLKSIEETLKKYSGVDAQLLNKKIIDELIEKITVLPTGESEAKVTFYLKSDEKVQKEYIKSSCSSGNIILIILPERHTVFTRNLRSYFNHEWPISYYYSVVI